MRLHLLITGMLLTSVHGSYTPEHVMVDLTNEFGACVLKLVASRTENVAFSPYGLVSVALVLYEGTNGPTAAEIHNSLRLPWDRQVTRIGFRDLHRYLKSYFSNDGFLRGLVLSKPNVVLNWNYTKQLLFYGFDLTPERPTKQPPPVGTTSAPFTLAPTTTVANTRPTTLVTLLETSATTEKKPEETTLATTAKETTLASTTKETTLASTTKETTLASTTKENTAEMSTKENRETTIATTTKVTTIPEEPSTENEVESKDTDEEIPDVEGPNETTKTNPPPSTEGATPPITTEDKATEVQTEQATESKPVTAETTQSPEKTTIVESGTTASLSTAPVHTTERVSQTERTITPAQTTTAPAASSEPAASTETATTPVTVATSSPPSSTTTPVSAAPSSSPTPTTTPVSVTTTPSSATTIATEATTSPPMTTMTSNPAPTTFMTTPESTTTTSPDSTTISPAPVTSPAVPETSPEAITIPPATEPSPVTSESTQAVESPTQAKPEEETDNVASESEMVTRKERALYHRGYDGEHREGIPNWVPHYQDPRWIGQAPLETWFFTPSGGEKVPVITYTAYLPFGYLQELEALALQLPLDDPRYYMLILLPEDREGLGKLLYSLQWCPLRGIVNQLKTTAVYATIPAFTVVKHINLVPALAKLGIVRVFDPLRADLTPMASEPGLYVRTIEQVVTVSLRKYFANHRWFDATPGDVEQHFIANHPFIYLVLDRETQVALMAGTIVNPIAHNQ